MLVYYLVSKYQKQLVCYSDLNLFFPTPVTLDEDWSLYAKLSNGKVIGCDFLVSATGVEPNTKLLKGEKIFQFFSTTYIYINIIFSKETIARRG